MTIKEVEARTGLARANIRYYEDQGFFSADRGENGYRNYSEENVETLLKVKLLRQLGFSLEEIHALQTGERALEPALEQREAGLEQERRELDQAARLCREMRADGADFYTLDARRYLDRLARAEEVLEKDRDPVRIFPWRRYFARELDFVIWRTLLTVVLQLGVHFNMLRSAQSAEDTMLLDLGALVLMAAGETLLLALTGTTPGKALLGLRVLREDGSRLGLEQAARRTGMVVSFFGASVLLADTGVLLLTLAGLGMLAWACWQVYHEKPLFWEGDLLYLDGSTRERAFWENSRNRLRVGGCLAVFAACVGLMVGGHYLVSRPPHRGENLTAEQFVDNYNQYMEFTYGRNNLSRRLTLRGTFEAIPDDSGTVVIDIFGESPVPEAWFFFRQGSGGLSKVVLTRRYEGSGPLPGEDTYGVGIPYDEIYVAMRSFLWQKLGEKGINALYEELVEQGGIYHAGLGDVQIDSEMNFSGYRPFGNDALFAEEGQTQSYFVEFIMELTE